MLTPNLWPLVSSYSECLGDEWGGIGLEARPTCGGSSSINNRGKDLLHLILSWRANYATLITVEMCAFSCSWGLISCLAYNAFSFSSAHTHACTHASTHTHTHTHIHTQTTSRQIGLWLYVLPLFMWGRDESVFRKLIKGVFDIADRSISCVFRVGWCEEGWVFVLLLCVCVCVCVCTFQPCSAIFGGGGA